MGLAVLVCGLYSSIDDIVSFVLGENGIGLFSNNLCSATLIVQVGFGVLSAVLSRDIPCLHLERKWFLLGAWKGRDGLLRKAGIDLNPYKIFV